jgi:hypothetical protein
MSAVKQMAKRLPLSASKVVVILNANDLFVNNDLPMDNGSSGRRPVLM